ncbi:cupin domain-containing protein [Kribbella sp. NPDC004875]|uniref:cupin domain-containing protein n=1 Tax=Kribbella sp. NPDC004875 TaxID=3364107 RepID=UPI0036C628E8
MPSANLATTPVAIDIPELIGKYAELDDYTVAFESYPLDGDPAEYFAGLPDDRCQCPHWGFVTAGAITFRWADHSETYRTGDAYYAGPGHLPLITAGTSLVEFSPTTELQKTMAVIGANLERAGAGA